MSSMDDLNGQFEELAKGLLQAVDEKNEEFLEQVREATGAGAILQNSIDELTSLSSEAFSRINPQFKPRLGVSEKALNLFGWMQDGNRKREYMWRYSQAEYAKAAEDWIQYATYLVMIFDGLSQDYLLKAICSQDDTASSSRPLDTLAQISESTTWWNAVTKKPRNVMEDIRQNFLGWTLSRPAKLFAARGPENEYWIFANKLGSDDCGFYAQLDRSTGKSELVRIERNNATSNVFKLKIDGVFFPSHILDSGGELAESDLYVLLSAENKFRSRLTKNGRRRFVIKVEGDVEVVNWAWQRVGSGALANVYAFHYEEDKYGKKFLGLKSPQQINREEKEWLSHELKLSDYPLAKRVKFLVCLLLGDESKKKSELLKNFETARKFRNEYCHLSDSSLVLDWKRDECLSLEKDLCYLIEQIMRVDNLRR